MSGIFPIGGKTKRVSIQIPALYGPGFCLLAWWYRSPGLSQYEGTNSVRIIKIIRGKGSGRYMMTWKNI